MKLRIFSTLLALQLISLPSQTTIAGDDDDLGDEDIDDDSGDGDGIDIALVPLFFIVPDAMVGRHVTNKNKGPSTLVSLNDRSTLVVPLTPVDAPASNVSPTPINNPPLGLPFVPFAKENPKKGGFLAPEAASKKIAALQLVPFPTDLKTKEGDLWGTEKSEDMWEKTSAFDHEPIDNYGPSGVDPFSAQAFYLEDRLDGDDYIVNSTKVKQITLIAGLRLSIIPAVGWDFVAKMRSSKGNWAERRASSYYEAIKMEAAKRPLKSSDFNNWSIGDKMRYNGIVNFTLYTGPGLGLSDMRAGGQSQRRVAIEAQKISKNQIRLSFTREVGGGWVARIQPILFTKSDYEGLKLREKSKVFIFDTTCPEAREALDSALKGELDPALEMSRNSSKTVSMVSARIMRSKKRSNLLHGGLPVLVRGRRSSHVIKSAYSIGSESDRIRTEGFITQNRFNRAYRYMKMRKPKGPHKKWKHFMHTNRHRNVFITGDIAGKLVENGGSHEYDSVRRRDLILEWNDNHDYTTTKNAKKRVTEFLARIGLHQLQANFDHDEKENIGYVNAVARLRLDDKHIQCVGALAQKEGFRDFAIDLAKRTASDYIEIEHDPAGECKKFRTRIKRQSCISIKQKSSAKHMGDFLDSMIEGSKDPKNQDTSLREISKHLARAGNKLAHGPIEMRAISQILPPTTKANLTIAGERFQMQKFNIETGRAVLEHMKSVPECQVLSEEMTETEQLWTDIDDATEMDELDLL